MLYLAVFVVDKPLLSVKLGKEKPDFVAVLLLELECAFGVQVGVLLLEGLHLRPTKLFEFGHSQPQSVIFFREFPELFLVAELEISVLNELPLELPDLDLVYASQLLDLIL